MSKHIKNPFIVSGLFFLFCVVFLFIFFNKSSRDSLVEQIQHRQQVVVRAGAIAIDGFLTSVGRALVILSNNPTQENLDEFISLWERSDVTGVIVTDSHGIVTKISNIKNINDIGGNVSDRAYFLWAKDAKEKQYKVFSPVVSQIGASKGNYVIPIAVPICDVNENFSGVITVVIELSNISKNYFNNLKVLDTSKIYMVTQSGEIVYSDQPELTGKKFKEIFTVDFLGKAKLIEIVDNALKDRSETKLKLAIPNFQNNFKLEPYLISASPITVSNNLWKLVVVTPESDLVTFTYKVFNSQILLVFIAVTLFVILSLRASRDNGYQEAVVDEHKKHNIS